MFGYRVENTFRKIFLTPRWSIGSRFECQILDRMSGWGPKSGVGVDFRIWYRELGLSSGSSIRIESLVGCRIRFQIGDEVGSRLGCRCRILDQVSGLSHKSCAGVRSWIRRSDRILIRMLVLGSSPYSSIESWVRIYDWVPVWVSVPNWNLKPDHEDQSEIRPET